MKYIGFFKTHELPVKNGDVVVIPKGTPYRSTHPQKTEGVTGRKQTVNIDHMLNGFKGSEDIGGTTRLENPSVRWAGTGGYWKWVDINDIREANLALFEKREKNL